jgi:hypothetical protein
MLIVLALAGVAYGAWRLAGAALQSLRGLPRSNDDMIFY